MDKEKAEFVNRTVSGPKVTQKDFFEVPPGRFDKDIVFQWLYTHLFPEVPNVAEDMWAKISQWVFAGAAPRSL